MDRRFKSDIGVLSRFASAFFENEPLRKTQLHLASRLRWDSFVRYLEWMQGNNYVACKSDRDGPRYYVTEDGRRMFLKLLEFSELVGVESSSGLRATSALI